MKIPFELTISNAYKFAFQNILSIIGIAWFPFALMVAVIGGVVYALLPRFIALFSAMSKAQEPDPAKIFEFVGTILLAEVLILPVVIVLSAMVSVGMMRKALGQHPGPVFFFFSLGSQVWRLVGSYFIMFLMMIGLVVLLAGISVGAYFLLEKASPGGAVAALIFLIPASYCFFIYAIVRTYFFIPAVVVAENHIGIRRSWHLGAGNFWRIIGILLIMTIPVGIASNMIMSPVLQMAMGGPAALPPNPTAQDMQLFFASLWTALKTAGPFLIAIQVLHFCLVSGLTAAATAQAYNSLTGGPDIVPPKAPAA